MVSRDLYGDGDQGKPAGFRIPTGMQLQDSVAGFPHRWKQMFWDSCGEWFEKMF